MKKTRGNFPGHTANYFRHKANLDIFQEKIQGGRIILKGKALSRKKPVIQSIYSEPVGSVSSGFKPMQAKASR